MQEALRALNRLVADHVIETYAIGGAIGAMRYIEAVPTEDIDAFVFLAPSPSGLLSLTPIYDALKAQGGIVEKEYVRFGPWPVQILTDANDLIREAILNAAEAEFDGTPARVFTAEHLCAIALQTGRLKDYTRVGMFFEQEAVDRDALETILARHCLQDRLARVDDLLPSRGRDKDSGYER